MHKVIHLRHGSTSILLAKLYIVPIEKTGDTILVDWEVESVRGQ
jgi:hypothetical protein